MSEPNSAVALLANHLIGDPISDHHGVRCCPAIDKISDEKYIVKIISIPASQVQLDALLLTGAYPSKEAALVYFQELAEAAVQETKILQQLSKLEGFCSYEGWQIVPMKKGVGCEVYLLGTYKPTLERTFRHSPMTHLAAVNLGLDLCAALSVCRRCGYLYVDLKPENVYITANGEYRIGDLGFIQLDSLKYASLPDKYRSAYTAPEIRDAYSSLNATLDIYAAGLILYQVFNNGELPAISADPSEGMLPPAYADYEMAEIILKACAAKPEDRWQSPEEMGQALVSYMQRNTVNDVPIIPPAIPDEPDTESDVEEFLEESAEEPEEIEALEDVTEEGNLPLIPTEVEPEESAAEEEPTVSDEEPTAAEEESTAADEEPTAAEEESATSEEEPTQEAEEPEQAEEIPEPEVSDIPEEEIIDDPIDETEPSDENSADLTDTEVSDEVSAMLAQADELIAHELPYPVVVPEPIEIPMPEPIVIEPQMSETQTEVEPEEVQAEATEEAETPLMDAAPAAEAIAPAEDQEPIIPEQTTELAPKSKKKYTGLIALLVTILILLMLACGAYYYYQNFYLQPILGISLTGDEDYLTVKLDTQIDNSLLIVACTDTYGNRQTQPVVNNTAAFTKLNSGTTYAISVEISGFHKLIGTTTATHTTATQTNIVSFTAKVGDQDGSVILNFSVQGPENTSWRIRYSAPGVEEKVAECSSHMATITGLEIGKRYTFRLEPVADLYVVGMDTLEYTATKLIKAQNLAIQGFNNGALIATWSAPEGVTVESWTVRCYNTDGYDTTLTVTEPQVAIEGLDPAQGYIIEVKAQDMTVSERVSISANSVTFKDLLLDDSTPGKLVITWNYEGTAPAEGWRLFYTVNGGEQHIIHCEKNTCTIEPLLPGGHYAISFELPDDITVIGGTKEYDAPSSGSFDSYGITHENLTFRMCNTRSDTGWKWYQLYETDFSNEFAVGKKASFVITVNTGYQASEDDLETLFVIKDEAGNIVSINAGRTRVWNTMWSKFKGRTGTELDMPTMPQTPGTYSVEIYFNNALACTYGFTVTE